MDEIHALDFGDPEVKDGEIKVPLKVKQRTIHGQHTINVWLTVEKLAALRDGAQDALDAAETVA